jgi:hypothetical protein
MRALPDGNKPAAKMTRRLALGLGVAALFAVKLGYLAVFGPNFQPDSGGYVDIANFIVAGRLNDPALAGGIFPPTLFRIMGYPALIALTKIIAGDLWPWLMVALQFAFSFVATVAIYRTARAFGLDFWARFAAAALQATGLPLLLDQAILTDSLCSSLITFALCGIAIAVLRGRGVVAASAGAGLLLALVFLMREATIFMAVGFVPLAIAAAVVSKPLHPRRLKVAVLICLLLPVLAVHRAYAEWGRSRVGVPIVTSAAQTALIQTLVEASRNDPEIFSGDTPLDRVARETIRNHDFFEVRDINKRLFEEHRLNAVQIASDAYAAYFRAWREHPRAMFGIFLSQMSERNTVHLMARPVTSLRELIVWNTGSDHGFAHERTLLEGQWWQLPFVVVYRLGQAVSVVLFVAFLVFTPWRLVAERWRSPAHVPEKWEPVFRKGHAQMQALAAAGLWFAYLTFFFVYAFVHLEPRYIAGVVSPAIVVAVANVVWFFKKARERHLRA